MKISGFLSVLLASKAIALAVPVGSKWDRKLTEQEVIHGLLENPQLFYGNSYELFKQKVLSFWGLAKRDPQSMGGGSMSMATIVGGIGVVGAVFESLWPVSPKAPKSTVRDTMQTNSVLYPGALRKKVRVGPYRIPATSEKNLESWLLHSPGMGNTFKYDTPKPCDKECTILSVEMSLEDANGEPAENAHGAWFHHAVILNAGPHAKAAMCGETPIEVIAMVGNEKGSVTYGVPSKGSTKAIKAGYHVNEKDTILLNTQLMNLDDREKFVWLTLTYDYVDGPSEDYLHSRVLWQFLSTTKNFPCVANTQNPWGPTNMTDDMQPKAMRFSEHTIPVPATMEGVIIAAGGHMHDGGTGIDIFQNDKIICTSVAKYKKGAAEGGHGHKKRQAVVAGGEAGNREIEHINDQTRCQFPEGIPLAKTDKMYIRANYDFYLHPGMKNDLSELSAIMGIVGVVVAEKTK